MGKQRRYTPEQIINKLREAEVLIGQGKTIGEAWVLPNKHITAGATSMAV